MNNLVYQATGLTSGGTYGFKIQAVNAIGNSIDSDTIYITCADLPDAPSAPTRDDATENSITVAWNAPAFDGGSIVTGYQLYMNDYETDEWTLVYDGANVDSVLVYEVDGLSSGSFYRFQVTAINDVGESDPSAEVSLQAADLPDAPS